MGLSWHSRGLPEEPSHALGVNFCFEGVVLNQGPLRIQQSYRIWHVPYKRLQVGLALVSRQNPRCDISDKMWRSETLQELHLKHVPIRRIKHANKRTLAGILQCT